MSINEVQAKLIEMYAQAKEWKTEHITAERLEMVKKGAALTAKAVLLTLVVLAALTLILIGFALYAILRTVRAAYSVYTLLREKEYLLDAETLAKAKATVFHPYAQSSKLGSEILKETNLQEQIIQTFDRTTEDWGVKIASWFESQALDTIEES